MLSNKIKSSNNRKSNWKKPSLYINQSPSHSSHPLASHKPLAMAKLLIGFAFLLLAFSSASSSSSSPELAPSINDECGPILIPVLTYCVGYLFKGSSIDVPPMLCCMGVDIVINNHHDCVCPFFTSMVHSSLNNSRVVALPQTCSLDQSSPYHCDGKYFLN